MKTVKQIIEEIRADIEIRPTPLDEQLDELLKSYESEKALERPHGEKKCPVCGNDLYEYCFSCCYEGEKVT